MKVLHALVIGSVLFDLRKEKNLTYKDCEEKIGITQSMYSRFENAKCVLTIETLSKMCTMLGSSLSSFFAEVESRVKFLANNKIQTILTLPSKEEETIEDIVSTIAELKVLNKVLVGYKTH